MIHMMEKEEAAEAARRFAAIFYHAHHAYPDYHVHCFYS